MSLQNKAPQKNFTVTTTVLQNKKTLAGMTQTHKMSTCHGAVHRIRCNHWQGRMDEMKASASIFIVHKKCGGFNSHYGWSINSYSMPPAFALYTLWAVYISVGKRIES